MIHPALEPYARAARESPGTHPSTQSIAERRGQYRALAESIRGAVEAVESVTDVTLDLDGRSLGARLYVPLEDEGRALIVYFHGGGFVLGDLDTHDALCRRLAVDTSMRLLAVDYRLAPEHPFPAAIDDAVDTIRHLADNLATFAATASKLIVMGDSAGGTIATVASSLTKGDVDLVAAQVVLYPTLGPELLTNSAHAYAQGYLLDIDHLRYDYEQYLDGWTDHADPRISPLMSSDLAGAPAAIVLVAECDPLRDEGVAYAGLLEHYGVAVELLEAEGMIHGFLRLGGLVPEAMEIVDDLAAHMRRFVEHAAT